MYTMFSVRRSKHCSKIQSFPVVLRIHYYLCRRIRFNLQSTWLVACLPFFSCVSHLELRVSQCGKCIRSSCCPTPALSCPSAALTKHAYVPCCWQRTSSVSATFLTKPAWLFIAIHFRILCWLAQTRATLFSRSLLNSNNQQQSQSSMHRHVRMLIHRQTSASISLVLSVSIDSVHTYVFFCGFSSINASFLLT